MSSDEDETVGRPVPRLQATPSPQTSASEIAAGLSRWMDAGGPFVYVELASLVLMLSCVFDWYPTTWFKYALSVSCVSLIACLTLQTAEFLIPGFLEWVVVERREDGSGGHTVNKIGSVVMLMWWIVGTGFVTFHAPFTVTSNGWVAAWGGLLASAKWSVGLKTSFYDEQPEGLRQLVHLAACSVVLLIACVPPLVQGWVHYGGAGFGIAGSAVTLVACAYLITSYGDVSKNVMKVTGIVLFVLWSFVAGVCTFHGPFLTTTNGYFASWLGCVTSLRLMIIEMKDASPENYV